MKGYYKKSREDIVKIIKNSPVTHDGYFYCEKFKDINMALGDVLEKKYVYNREYFENKICFSLSDIDAYLETELDAYDVYTMKQKDNYLYDIIKDDIGITKLNDVIDKYGNTYEDVIDTCIYFLNNK